MKLYLDGIGLVAPGLAGWSAGRQVLAGTTGYEIQPVQLVASELLPPSERRRTTDTVKLALAVGIEAAQHAAQAADSLPSVFASSGADGATITAILDILTSPAREVSPTRFHNSVHNAPSGYWGIATGSQQASVSLCAYDFSFAAGLVEAASRALTERRSVLLVAYDLPYPRVLNVVRPIAALCGVGLVVSAAASDRTLAELSVTIIGGGPSETVMSDAGLEALRTGNPAARALPLLATIARREHGMVVLPYGAATLLSIAVVPGSGRGP